MDYHFASNPLRLDLMGPEKSFEFPNIFHNYGSFELSQHYTSGGAASSKERTEEKRSDVWKCEAESPGEKEEAHSCNFEDQKR